MIVTNVKIYILGGKFINRLSNILGKIVSIYYHRN